MKSYKEYLTDYKKREPLNYAISEVLSWGKLTGKDMRKIGDLKLVNRFKPNISLFAKNRSNG